MNVRNERPPLEVNSLMYTEGPRAGINFEVMDAYLKRDPSPRRDPPFTYPTLEYVNLEVYAQQVKSAFQESADLAYIVYMDGLQWRLMIAKKERPTMLYDPCLATRYNISRSEMKLRNLLHPKYRIMTWPQQANPIDSGPLVLLAIQKYIEFIKPTQRMINRDVLDFRVNAAWKLAAWFRLTLDGLPYMPPADGPETGFIRRPKLNVQLLTKRKARIDADVMYAYMNFLLEKFQNHAFRVIDKPEETSAAQLYEEIFVELTNSTAVYFYVAYHQTKRWRLFVIHKQPINPHGHTFRHFDPADPNPDGEESQFAQDLMKRLSDGLKLRRFEDPWWPRTKRRAYSGAYVLKAVSHHRDSPYDRWSVTDDDADEFRTTITKDLKGDYELTAFGKPFRLEQLPVLWPAPLAESEEVSEEELEDN